MNHLLAPLGVVVRKELIDGVRDRRSIISAVVPLAIIPLMLFFGFSMASDEIESSRRITVPVAGAGHAQALIDWLDSRSGVEIEPGVSQPRAAVENDEHEFVLVVPEDFGGRFEESRPAEVEIVVDSSNSRAGRAVGRLRSLIRAYAGQISSQRLIARGVSPEVVQPIRIEEIELATSQERAAMAFSFIPVILLMTAFIGGLQIAIDSTAGERERVSLEPLLLNPVPRLSIVGGKWLASAVFALASMLLTTAMLQIVLARSPLQRLGVDLHIDMFDFGSMLAIIFPLALFGSALEMFIATLSRSYKEAQTYVSFLMFVPMLPMMLTMGSSIEPAMWKLCVPVLGQHIMVIEILEGKAPQLLSFVIATSAAIGMTFLFLALIAHQFSREKIVFGR